MILFRLNWQNRSKFIALLNFAFYNYIFFLSSFRKDDVLVGAPLFSSDRYDDEGRVYIFENIGTAPTVSVLIYKVFRKTSSGQLLLPDCKILKGAKFHLR